MLDIYYVKNMEDSFSLLSCYFFFQIIGVGVNCTPPEYVEVRKPNSHFALFHSLTFSLVSSTQFSSFLSHQLLLLTRLASFLLRVVSEETSAMIVSTFFYTQMDPGLATHQLNILCISSNIYRRKFSDHWASKIVLSFKCFGICLYQDSKPSPV